MTTMFLVCTLTAATAVGQAASPRANPLLNNQAQQAEMDRIVDRFIAFDSGRAIFADGLRIQQDFNRLDVQAIPALVRGMNKAAALQMSCPVMAISNKLRALLSFTEDPRLLDAVAAGLGVGVDPSAPHMETLRTLRNEVLQRRAAVEQGKIAAQRARDLFLQQLYVANAKTLKAALKHEQTEVRWAATRVVAGRGLPFGDELIALLDDPDAHVQEAAHQALLRLSRGLDYGPKREASDDDRLAAQDEWRKWWEAGRIGLALPRAAPAQQADMLTRLREGKGVAYTVALADAIPQLSASLRVQAQDALTERLGRMSAATLRDKLQDANREVRRSAALACILREDQSLIPDLIGLLEDPESIVARAAHLALKTLSGKDLGPASGASASERADAIRAWRAWWSKLGSR